MSIQPEVPRVGGCDHPACDRDATYERGGFRLCFDHFLVALQWEQQGVA